MAKKKYNLNPSAEDQKKYELSMGGQGPQGGSNDILIRNLDNNIIASNRQPSHLPENSSAFPDDNRRKFKRNQYGVQGGYIVDSHEYVFDTQTQSWSES